MKVLAEFSVRVIVHTNEADELFHPDYIKHKVGIGLDRLGVEEGIDYSLEVTRVHV